VNRKPGLIAMRFTLGFAFPVALFLVLYLPVLTSLYGALESLASSEGIRGVLERPGEALSLLLGPVLFSYLALLISMIAALYGGMLSDASLLKALSGQLLKPGGATPARGIINAGRGFLRPLMLYSLVYSIALLLVLFAIGLIAVIVFALAMALAAEDALYMSTMLLLTAGSVFLLTLLCLHSIRLEGLAFLSLDGLRPPEAFFRAARALWQDTDSAGGIGLMLACFALFQPLMAALAFVLGRIQGMGAVLAVAFWCLAWLLLDIYIGAGIKATVLVSHYNRTREVALALMPVTLDDVAAFLKAADEPAVLSNGVWDYFEREEGGVKEEREAPDEQDSKGGL